MIFHTFTSLHNIDSRFAYLSPSRATTGAVRARSYSKDGEYKPVFVLLYRTHSRRICHGPGQGDW
jgi:hypothetical protein